MNLYEETEWVQVFDELDLIQKRFYHGARFIFSSHYGHLLTSQERYVPFRTFVPNPLVFHVTGISFEQRPDPALKQKEPEYVIYGMIDRILCPFRPGDLVYVDVQNRFFNPLETIYPWDDLTRERQKRFLGAQQ